MLIEACVDTLASAREAERGGADRVELCDNLIEGGTTPTRETLRLALAQLNIPVFPMIRPRGGGFVYGAGDLAIMRAELRYAQELGARGAVIGALTTAGDVDEDVIATLRAEARRMQLTFHRAFDECRDAGEALETLIRLGIDRVLTSGQRPTAWEGRETLAALVRQAAGRITILAGGNVREDNAAELVGATGVTEVHFRTATAERVVAIRKALSS